MASAPPAKLKFPLMRHPAITVLFSVFYLWMGIAAAIAFSSLSELAELVELHAGTPVSDRGHVAFFVHPWWGLFLGCIVGAAFRIAMNQRAWKQIAEEAKQSPGSRVKPMGVELALLYGAMALVALLAFMLGVSILASLGGFVIMNMLLAYPIFRHRYNAKKAEYEAAVEAQGVAYTGPSWGQIVGLIAGVVAGVLTLSVMTHAVVRAGGSLDRYRSLDSFAHGVNLDAAQAAALEARLAKDPQDFDARAQLLGYYEEGEASADVAARLREHALWWVDHRPEVVLPLRWQCMAARTDDKETLLAEFEAHWRNQVERFPGDTAVLENATWFFLARDNLEEAIALMERCMAIDPDNSHWRERRGYFIDLLEHRKAKAE